MIGFIVLGDREPRLEGYSLSYWAARAISPRADGRRGEETPAEQAQAEDVLHRIGTNALPFLMEWVAYESSPWRDRLAITLCRLPIVKPYGVAHWIRGSRLEQRAYAAAYAFKPLGQQAIAAIPELERMASDPNRRTSATCAAMALANIGPEALPALFRVVTNTQATARTDALLCVTGMGSNATLAVPALIGCLKDTDWHVASSAAGVLAKLGVQAEICVPAIAEQLRESNRFVRVAAVRCLRRFGKEARPAVGSLLNAASDPDLGVRRAATNALREIAPEVLTDGTGGSTQEK
jgi:hypothetical protein